jgi:hypothetical protein
LPIVSGERNATSGGLGTGATGEVADSVITKCHRSVSARQASSPELATSGLGQTRPKLDVRGETAIPAITDIVIYGHDLRQCGIENLPSWIRMARTGETKLPHNRRRRSASDSRTALVRLSFGYRVEPAIHLTELGVSLSIGI